MLENEPYINNQEAQKEKIRQRYKGTPTHLLKVIPANSVKDFDEDTRPKRVAVYVRVSTDDPRQTSSYELQKNHYTDTVNRHKSWQLIDIYADEGISGTSLNHRDAFIRMISDCQAGKIDLIITKSISRFSRNVLDCIGYVRLLASMKPPVEVFFEAEGIHTLSDDSEMQLTFLAAIAQEESHHKSQIMNASYGMRFSRGLFLTPELLGYNHDENGNLVINAEEALTIKFIFYMCLLGYSCPKIANELTKLGRKTKKGNTIWNPSSIRQILQNERYCGDILAQKTWTPNYLDHKSQKNNKDKNQYLHENHHEAIISRYDFIAAQKMLRNFGYNHNDFLPEIKVITEGVLKGFIPIHPTWAGFKSTDYIEAVDKMVKEEKSPSYEMAVSIGEFDLRGFEIAHGQFFSSSDYIRLTFDEKTISASLSAIQKLASSEVELLVNPKKLLFAVRAAAKNTKNSVIWAREASGKYTPRPIRGRAFLPALYELFSWKEGRKYRIYGVRHQNCNETVLIFDINDAEVLLPANIKEKNTSLQSLQFDGNVEPLGTKYSIIGYPANWANNFGTPYYTRQYSHETELFNQCNTWDIQNTGQPYITDFTKNITPPKELIRHVDSLVNTMTKENTSENDSS